MKRIFVVIISICIFLYAFTGYTSANSENIDISWKTIQGKANNFISQGHLNGNEKNFNAGPLVVELANILTTIGVVIVLAGLLIMGIKYMTATPDEAAKLKIKLIGLLIAGVVIVGAYGIWKLVGNFLFSIT